MSPTRPLRNINLIAGATHKKGVHSMEIMISPPASPDSPNDPFDITNKYQTLRKPLLHNTRSNPKSYHFAKQKSHAMRKESMSFTDDYMIRHRSSAELRERRKKDRFSTLYGSMDDYNVGLKIDGDHRSRRPTLTFEDGAIVEYDEHDNDASSDDYDDHDDTEIYFNQYLDKIVQSKANLLKVCLNFWSIIHESFRALLSLYDL